MSRPVPLGVIWHDIECGNYLEDLPLWRDLAAEADGPVLDVGAGAGRVALDLAVRGFDVVGLDIDAELLEALSARAKQFDVTIETVVADARTFDLGTDRFGLVAVPMQTLQLLPDAAARAEFFVAARRALRPGGHVAIALADALDSFDGETDGLPEPDVGEIAGVQYASLPLAVVDEGDYAAIHRLRKVIGDDSVPEEHDVIRLARVDPVGLADEAEAAAGFEAAELRRIPATDVYVGSTVVVLRG
ncbi:class I SAM-dependent methyltransferase [Conexibacter woesei]|uniref:class I SAM-dependent methyltransferase n=1 Tax=Conexibacter woesei TaxID=191495 RepID=UPI00068423D8|nr:class I SAM-dependent methyltransferase [Conexibacter woesei]